MVSQALIRGTGRAKFMLFAQLCNTEMLHGTQIWP